MAENVVDVQNLTKVFRSGLLAQRRREALRGVSLSVPRGAIYGILGPNGAGKTTLLSILGTLLLPDAGSATVLGYDVVSEAGEIRRRINMASGHANFPWSMYAEEILDFYGCLYGLSGRARRRKVEELLTLCELLPHRATPYNQLSTGLKQRLSLAKSLLNDPEVLLLDEPTVGLDPDIARRLREQIATLRREQGSTVLLSTHYMREAEQLCDEIAFLREGQIVARGSGGDLTRTIRVGAEIRVEAQGLSPRALQELRMVPGVVACRVEGSLLIVQTEVGASTVDAVLRTLMQEGVVLRGVQVREPDLEEVFLALAK